jgi:regulator of protease activity HflC (stomatin/prohibitin superfamily)
MNSASRSAIIVGILILAISVMLLICFDITTIHGNEMAVKETWAGGVDEQPYGPKTYFLFPGWSQKMIPYDMSSRVFVMNDIGSKHEMAEGREMDSYKVQSKEGQDMWISLSVRWRVDPDKLIEVHKLLRENIEEKLIRPTVMLVVKNQATQRTAIEAYSGEGLVKLQTDILNELADTEGEMRHRGVIVENFVIEGIRLNDEYIGQIVARQVAMQRQSRAAEETKAAEAEALKAKAEAQSDYNRRVVEAEGDKQVGILAAEQDAQKQVLAAEADAKKVGLAAEAEKNKTVLAAEADAQKVGLAAEAEKNKTVLAAEGEQQAGQLKAQAILAIGNAEAEAQKMRLQAYAVDGAEAFVKIEVAKQVAVAFGGIKGYLPSDMRINLLSESFDKSVQTILSAPEISGDRK